MKGELGLSAYQHLFLPGSAPRSSYQSHSTHTHSHTNTMAPTPFTEFEHHDVAVKSRVVGDLKIHTRKYGKGEPLLLIHGYPQNSQ